MRTLLTLTILAISTTAAGAAQSERVHFGPDGKLVYKSTERGDRIMDFSSAGYMGGGVKLPDVPAANTLAPTGADDSAAIQAAIDQVSKTPLVNGFRGAVLLKPGVFNCDTTLLIKESGVVLRGSDQTTLKLIGRPHSAISVGVRVALQPAGQWVGITDRYVPSGAATFQVRDASSFSPGHAILVRRPVTASWVQFMGMDKLVRNGRNENWVSGQIFTERSIRQIDGNRITLDIPLSDSFDAAYLSPPGGAIAAFNSKRISQVGIERLRIVSPPQPVMISQPHYSGINLSGVVDAWVRDVEIADSVDTLSVGGGAKRVTIQNVDVTHSVPTKGSAKPADFSADGTQILFNRCSCAGDDLFYVVTGARATGPIVLLDCTFRGHGWVQPHQRWATGLLVDNCHVPDGGIDFMNRGEMGSGHGWTIGWAVAWNCQAKSFTIQQPPGAMNWAIGCQGERRQAAMPFGKEPKLPEGMFDLHGTPVSPRSLYLAQLRERLGDRAVDDVEHGQSQFPAPATQLRPAR